MNDNELFSNLSYEELLEIVHTLSAENRRLKDENNRLREALEQWTGFSDNVWEDLSGTWWFK